MKTRLRSCSVGPGRADVSGPGPHRDGASTDRLAGRTDYGGEQRLERARHRRPDVDVVTPLLREKRQHSMSIVTVGENLVLTVRELSVAAPVARAGRLA